MIQLFGRAAPPDRAPSPSAPAGPTQDYIDPSFTTGLPKAHAGTTQLHEILTIVFAVTAALSILMIVLGGLRFITGQGNPQETAKARNTIVYAVVGLVISLSAEAIVAFTLGKV